MTLSDALSVLESCRWMKIRPTSITAKDYRTREELAMLSREELLDERDCKADMFNVYEFQKLQERQEAP